MTIFMNKALKSVPKGEKVNIKMKFNAVQKAAYKLIQSDARFLYSLTLIQQQSMSVNSNYILMSQPYIGLFADGAVQWCKKVGLRAPMFSENEKRYYTDLRQGLKLYDLTYLEYKSSLMRKLKESDTYFFNSQSRLQKCFGYHNVGVDLCNGEFSGNTVLCAMYTPVDILSGEELGPWLRDVSIIAGKLAAYFECTNYGPYHINNNINVKTKDYHFYQKCPLKETTEFGFMLFSILCSINYAVEFIDKLFTDEIPQKFKYAYLQYYYLCGFVEEINKVNGSTFYLNNSLKDRSFRNCLAHYGLGQYLTVEDLIVNDPLVGLTMRAFGKDYMTTKKILFTYLAELTNQIKDAILK